MLFAGRNGHASTVFDGKLWLVGGRSNDYTKWDLGVSNRRADVWFSHYGNAWFQVTRLHGDFEEQNKNVKVPGPVAPFWERFGHSLHTINLLNETTNGIGLVPEAMVIFGGFAPEPMNDMWISANGVNWSVVHPQPSAKDGTVFKSRTGKYNGPAVWPSPRGYHGGTIYKGL